MSISPGAIRRDNLPLSLALISGPVSMKEHGIGTLLGVEPEFECMIVDVPLMIRVRRRFGGLYGQQRHSQAGVPFCQNSQALVILYGGKGIGGEDWVGGWLS